MSNLLVNYDEKIYLLSAQLLEEENAPGRKSVIDAQNQNASDVRNKYESTQIRASENKSLIARYIPKRTSYSQQDKEIFTSSAYSSFLSVSIHERLLFFSFAEQAL